MRKSVLIMHGGTESEIMRPDRSRQAGWADWQFDLICTNGGLYGEGREEEEEVWMAATVCSSNISWLRTSSKQASSLPWAFQWAVPCVQQTVCDGFVPVMCQVGEDHVFNQSSFPPPNLIRSVRVAGLRGGWESWRVRGRIKSKLKVPSTSNLNLQQKSRRS